MVTAGTPGAVVSDSDSRQLPQADPLGPSRTCKVALAQGQLSRAPGLRRETQFKVTWTQTFSIQAWCDVHTVTQETVKSG